MMRLKPFHSVVAASLCRGALAVVAYEARRTRHSGQALPWLQRRDLLDEF